MVEVVGLTISFLVAVEAVGSISLTAEVGRSPWGSMGQFISILTKTVFPFRSKSSNVSIFTIFLVYPWLKSLSRS